jgi:hypothetical protein
MHRDAERRRAGRGVVGRGVVGRAGRGVTGWLTAVLVAAGLALAGCADAPGGPGGGATPVPRDLDAARAAWAASGASGEYQLQVVPTCFCPQIAVTSTVRDGQVVDRDAYPVPEAGGGGGPVDAELAKAVPATVEALFAVIEKQSGAAAQSVTYSREGIPVSMWFDPVANAADDEFGYSVTLHSAAGGSVPADDGVWTKAELPDGAAFPADLPVTGHGNVQSVLVDGRLYLGLWGSSSCPDVPRGLGTTVRDEGGAQVVRVYVDVDATQPDGRACTADYGPTVYSAALPSEVATTVGGSGPGAQPGLPVVVTTATGTRDATGITVAAVQAAGARP